MAESISATREIETSEFDLIDIKAEEELEALRKELILKIHSKNEKKAIKAKMRQILRESTRTLKYCENVGVDKYIKAPTNIQEIKELLKEKKEMVLENGFRNFYLEYHQGKKGENHIQILADTKDKEKEIKSLIVDSFKNKDFKKEVEKKPNSLDMKLKKLDNLVAKHKEKYNNWLNSKKIEIKQEIKTYDENTIETIKEKARTKRKR